MTVDVVSRTNYRTDNRDNATPMHGLMRRVHVVHQLVGVAILMLTASVKVVPTTEIKVRKIRNISGVP